MSELSPPAAVLSPLHTEIDQRVELIRHDHPEWPCQKGCAACCHRLAEIPHLTAPEWALLAEGLAQLPPTQRHEIMTKVAAMPNTQSRPYVCPMLDPTTSACTVYPYRPIACRSYGYYVQRHQGLYCREIELRVADGEWAEVIWGNQDAVERQLAGLGEVRSLVEWVVSKVII